MPLSKTFCRTTKETAYRNPATPARTAHVPANLSKDVGLRGAASFSTGWVVIRYSPSVIDVVLGSGLGQNTDHFPEVLPTRSRRLLAACSTPRALSHLISLHCRGCDGRCARRRTPGG